MPSTGTQSECGRRPNAPVFPEPACHCKKIAVEQAVEWKLLAFQNEELEAKVEEWKREAGSVPDFPAGVPPPSPPPSPPRSALPGFWLCPAPECRARNRKCDLSVAGAVRKHCGDYIRRARKRGLMDEVHSSELERVKLAR